MFTLKKFEELVVDPYPVGIINPIFDEDIYREMVDKFPHVDLFSFRSELGGKSSFSSRFDSKYYQFIQENKIWKNFNDFINSDECFFKILQFLKQNKINLFNSGHKFINTNNSLNKNIEKFFKLISLNKLKLTSSPFYSKFEFSIMKGSGGHILPHTDSPKKIITIVINILDPNEWEDNWGGGTSIVKPKDKNENYNYLNKQFEFNQIENIKTFKYTPNQAVLFVKTFNSFHCVYPIKSTNPNSLRRTLTINFFVD